jgi:hypothetical protein
MVKGVWMQFDHLGSPSSLAAIMGKGVVYVDAV